MSLLRRGLLLGTGLALLVSQVGRSQTPEIQRQVDELLARLRNQENLKLVARAPAAKAEASGKVDLYGDPLPQGAQLRLGTVRFRHGSPVSSVRYGPDGKSLLSIGQDLSVRVWEASTGKEKQHFAGSSALIGPAAFMALSSDARLIAAIDGNNGMRVSDLVADKVLWQAKEPARRLSFPAFSPDGKLLAVLVVDDNNNDGLIRLWDTASGKAARDLVGKPKGENQQPFFPIGFAFSGNGKVLVALGNDDGGGNTFRLWEVASGKELPKLDKLIATNGVIAITPDGKHLAAVTQDTNVFKMLLGGGGSALCLWDATTGKLVRRLGENQNQVTGLLFSPDGKTLAVFENNQDLHLWNVANGKELPAPPGAGGNQQPLGALAFSPDSKLLALVGSNAGKIVVSEVATGKQLHEFKGYQFDGNVATPGQISNGQLLEGSNLAFSPDSKRLAAGSTSIVRQWNLDTGKEINPVSAGHEGEVRAIAFAPDGKRVATGGGDGTVRIWDRATGQELKKLAAPDPEVPQDNDIPALASALAFTPDGKQLLIGWDDGTIQLSDPATGKEIRQFKGHEFGVNSLAVATGGRAFASGGEDGRAYWWDLATGKQLRQFAGPIGADPNPNNPPSGLDVPTTVALSPDSRLIAVLNSDQLDMRIQLVELLTGKVRKEFKLRLGGGLSFEELRGIKGAVAAPRRAVLGDGLDLNVGGSMRLAYSPDGKMLAWSCGSTIRLWDLTAGKEVRQFGGQEQSIEGMSFAPDGKRLLASSGDGTIRVWEVATGTILGDIRGHRGGVASLAFAPDGLVLATGGQDTTALLWDLKSALADEQPRPGIPNAAEIDQLWKSLADEDGAKADQAIDQLLSAPVPAIALFKDRIKPTPPIDGPRIDRLLADLENDQFEVRKQAAETLEKLGELAEARLRKRLADNPSLDLKMRIEQLMEKLAGPVTAPELIQAERAIEVLERIGTAEARGVLESLARGAPESRLTQSAAGALNRLK